MVSLSAARAGEQRRTAASVAPTAREAFRRAVLAGLATRPPALSSVWFYDAPGSLLFQRIMRLPGYYPTRVETEILDASAGEILARLPVAPGAIVDLGAGDGAKTRLLLAAARRLSAAVAYAPVDVAGEALRSATARMRAVWPDLVVRAERAEYVEGLARARQAAGSTPVLGLLLGSNIGNLEWAEAVALLRSLRGALAEGDHLLVGLDLLKGERILRAAYDDPEGVTAAFNLNLLARINRELSGDVDLSAFAHRATFDPTRPAMESWLVARRATAATVAGRRFPFRVGEAIHTEISWKYTDAQVEALPRAAGFEEVARWYDGRRWFCDALWRVGAGTR